MASALLRLFHARVTTEVVHFMDGPYRVEVVLSATGLATLSAMKHDREIMCREASVLLLLESTAAAGEVILQACREHQHASADVERLTACVPLLRRKVVQVRASAEVNCGPRMTESTRYSLRRSPRSSLGFEP
jgi:hypothetical protein